jgi:hypothetical protein
MTHKAIKKQPPIRTLRGIWLRRSMATSPVTLNKEL